MKPLFLAVGLWYSLSLAVDVFAATVYLPGRTIPPSPAREFRGAWVASVNNIDWPSKPGLPVAQQKAELVAILDRARQLRLNAVVLQVRPACDALYASRIEPWSEYLTGEMGRPPQPYYDPLQFAVAEAHQRGIELHAWFNPFRARHSSGRAPASNRHVSRTHPSCVRAYGKELWLDPGDRAVQDYSLSVILDVVRRYDIDGVHLDDYFYPYPCKDAAGQHVDFPDDRSWRRYLESGGRLSRPDWRRENVNTFIHRLYLDVKARKRWVKVGVSPFGIWRPGYPASVRGFDAWDKLYADSRAWLANGWLDYCSPQLYWPIDAPSQSYPELLNWWSQQNTCHRHLWPGNNLHGAANRPGEIAAQVRWTRRIAGTSGNLLWSMGALMSDKGGVASDLSRLSFTEPALVPASPWLDSTLPGKPPCSLAKEEAGWTIRWKRGGSDAASRWVLQLKDARGWNTSLLSGSETGRRLGRDTPLPQVVALRGLDRYGNLGPAAVLERVEK